MKIKTGDKVKIIAGKDRGKTGKVLQVFIAKNKASIEGLNLLIKHMRPRKQGEKGQRIEFPASMDISNMLLICPSCSKPVKVGYKQIEEVKIINQAGKEIKKIKRKKERICRKCGQIIK